MTNWEEITSDDLKQIRRKINYKYEQALVLTLAFTIPLFFVSPFIPGKRGRPSTIETTGYWNAMLNFMIFWVIILAIVGLYNVYKARRDYEQMREKLLIRTRSDVIKSIKTQFMDSTYKKVYLKTSGVYLIDKDMIRSYRKEDMVEIRIEANTEAVLSIKRLSS